MAAKGAVNTTSTVSKYTTSNYHKLLAVFGPDIPIIEATTILRATMMPAHDVGAIEKDGLCCVLAKMLGTDVAVLKCKTYILSEYKGKPALVKYANGASAQAFIQMFDRGVRLTRPLEIEFLPIAPSHTKAHLDERHRRAAVYRKVHGHDVPRAYTKPSLRIMFVEVRKGLTRTLVADKAHRCAVRYQVLGKAA